MYLGRHIFYTASFKRALYITFKRIEVISQTYQMCSFNLGTRKMHSKISQRLRLYQLGLRGLSSHLIC